MALVGATVVLTVVFLSSATIISCYSLKIDLNIILLFANLMCVIIVHYITCALALRCIILYKYRLSTKEAFFHLKRTCWVIFFGATKPKQQEQSKAYQMDSNSDIAVGIIFMKVLPIQLKCAPEIDNSFHLSL
jgi:hypothetical protein